MVSRLERGGAAKVELRTISKGNSMTTPDSTSTRAPVRARSGVVGAASVLAALSIFWIATENHYSACVEAQVAKYPSVGVSAFNTKATGPIKVAYDAERRTAVGKCKHFLFV